MDNTKQIVRIFLAADHSGVELKTAIIKHLEDKYQLIDLGTNSETSVNYANFGFVCASKAVEYKCLGIAICGTGIGISIAANKVKGARCALLYNNEVAKLAKMHNDANVIALSSRQFSIAQNLAMIDEFLSSRYEAGRHSCRIGSIDEFENNNK